MLKLKQQSSAGFPGFTAQSQSPVSSPAFLGKCISLLPKATGVKEDPCGLHHGFSDETSGRVLCHHHTSLSTWTRCPPTCSAGLGCASILCCTAHAILCRDFCFFMQEMTFVYQQNNKHSFIVLLRKHKQCIHLIPDSGRWPSEQIKFCLSICTEFSTIFSLLSLRRLMKPLRNTAKECIQFLFPKQLIKIFKKSQQLFLGARIKNKFFFFNYCLRYLWKVLVSLSDHRHLWFCENWHSFQ